MLDSNSDSVLQIFKVLLQQGQGLEMDLLHRET